MNRRTRFIHIAFAAGILLVPFSAVPISAATVPAASCSQAHVQTAIDRAAAGDTVLVPAGTCTWSTMVRITGKRLKLLGAGIDITNINDSTTSGALGITASTADFVDVSGFTFIKARANSDGMVQIAGTQGDVSFRFHHNRLFDNRVAGGRGIYVSSTYGLIDHVTIDVTDTTTSDQMISVDGSSIGSDGGYTPWMQPLSLGTNKAVYVEDCTFTVANQNEDVIDAYSGARLVIRHNVFNDTAVGFHGTDSGGNRGVVSVELYDNAFTNNSANQRRAVTNRGGTALYFNNSYGGTRGYAGLTLLSYRATIADNYTWNRCDGTRYDIGSATFSTDASRTTTTYGTAARFLASNPDAVCTGSTAGVCSRGFDGSGARGYPCRDQPGRGPNGQTLSPIYAWNNGGIRIETYDGGCSACGGLPISTWVAENRDYYNVVPSGFNGTVGVGQGVLANRPSTCTPLTAYFAADVGPQGTLYQCATPNLWKEHYVPYTYPHYLQDGAPAPPTNLTIK